MSDIQHKPRYTNRNDINLDGIYSIDIPDGTYKMVNDAFKKWEVRRGFISEDQQNMGLRGRAYHYGEFAKKKKESEKKTVVKRKKSLIKKKLVAKKKVSVKKKTAKTTTKKK